MAKLNAKEVKQQIIEAQKAIVDLGKHSNLNRTLIISALWVLIGIVLTLLFSVGAFIQSSFAEKAAGYQSLVTKSIEQGSKLDQVTKELEKYNQKYGRFTCKYEKGVFICQP